MKKLSVLSAAAVIVAAQMASAGVCDNKPSAWVGSAGLAAITAITGGATGAGAVGKAAGLYALTHATSGAVMLGSTAGGASAAGTVGIMGGTAGTAVAYGMSYLLMPAVLVSFAGATIGHTAWEGACYLAGE